LHQCDPSRELSGKSKLWQQRNLLFLHGYGDRLPTQRLPGQQSVPGLPVVI
jgi:hypothetical protein